MKDLEQCRKDIEEIDKAMAELFEKRMETAGCIAEYKKTFGLPIFDAAREKALIERNLEYIENDTFKMYYELYLKDVMEISKKYQHTKLEGIKVAYCGIEGSFASIAAARILPDATKVPCKSFRAAYEAVENGDCELCVLPVENSYAGEVGQVSDLMFGGDLSITGIYELSVSQCLLGVPGSSLATIKTVYSHPQALDQCAEFLNKNSITSNAMENTAVAARKVSQMNDVSVGAIASRESAELYGLTVVQEQINESATNVTKFAVFTKHYDIMKNAAPKSTYIMMFTVENAAGTLARAIAILGKYGYSMKVIRSRPLKDVNWQYYFYTEVEGNLYSDNGEQMIAELKKECASVKIVGAYKVGTKI